MFGTVALGDALSMLWFVSGAIGLVELLRYLQERLPGLGRPWTQGLVFGLTSALLFGLVANVLHVADAEEVALIVPFLGMLAGAEGAIAGSVALALVMPALAWLALISGAATWVLTRFRASPLFALPVAWLVIAVQGAVFAGSYGRTGLAIALQVLLSVLGALAFYAYVHEIDRRRRALLQAKRHSATDPLTGLMNRRGLEEWLGEFADSSKAVIMIDLDDFKPINEIYGHDSGDHVLREAAGRLAGSVRPKDVVARIGGDEFVAILPGADAEAAIEVAERMQSRLGAEAVAVAGASLRLSASFGIAAGQGTACLAAADAALLRAKAQGKAGIEVYGTDTAEGDDAGRLLRVTSFARELMFRLPLGVVVTDPERRILASSAGYQTLSGFGAEHLRGRKPRQVVGTDMTDPTIFVDVKQALEGNGMWQGEFVNRRPAGDIWWAQWALAPIEVRGRNLGHIGVVLDATPYRMREAEMLAQAVAFLLEGHDGEIQKHLQRTRAYMRLAVARWQERYGRDGLPYNPEQYALASTLHDVGKLSVAPSILMKPGPLSESERAMVDRHPVEGALYLQRLQEHGRQRPESDYIRIFLRLATEFALHHHEQVDGGGYPHGLTADDLPLSVRIFSAVNAYDALQADRPYKAARPEDEAFTYLSENAGRRFDPEVVGLIGQLRLSDAWRAARAAPASLAG